MSIHDLKSHRYAALLFILLMLGLFTWSQESAAKCNNPPCGGGNGGGNQDPPVDPITPDQLGLALNDDGTCWFRVNVESSTRVNYRIEQQGTCVQNGPIDLSDLKALTPGGDPANFLPGDIDKVAWLGLGNVLRVNMGGGLTKTDLPGWFGQFPGTTLLTLNGIVIEVDGALTSAIDIDGGGLSFVQIRGVTVDDLDGDDGSVATAIKVANTDIGPGNVVFIDSTNVFGGVFDGPDCIPPMLPGDCVGISIDATVPVDPMSVGLVQNLIDRRGSGSDGGTGLLIDGIVPGPGDPRGVEGNKIFGDFDVGLDVSGSAGLAITSSRINRDDPGGSFGILCGVGVHSVSRNNKISNYTTPKNC